MVIFTWYFANQEAIIKEFCVNKDKPELQCKGKCHLKEVLTNTEDSNGPSSSYSISSEIFFPHFFQENKNKIYPIGFLSSRFSLLQDLRSNQFIPGVFHPPPNVFFF